ncbi:MAG: hypothetical protein AAF958_11940 [Planctomycetota bacterium]
MSEEHPASVWMLSGDLFFASKIKGVVEAVGGTFKISKTLPGAEDAPTCVLFDLKACGDSLADDAATCRQCFPNAKLIAYGPHVQTTTLQAARAAGIGTVLTNSQFSRDVAHWVLGGGGS